MYKLIGVGSMRNSILSFTTWVSYIVSLVLTHTNKTALVSVGTVTLLKPVLLY
jgi:hypothetical protein